MRFFTALAGGKDIPDLEPGVHSWNSPPGPRLHYDPRPMLFYASFVIFQPPLHVLSVLHEF